MSRAGFMWWILLMAVACAPAKFVNPVQPVSEGPYESGKTDKPEVRELLTEKFRWKRASGQIHVAIVLHVHTGQERQVFDMLREVVRTVDLKQFRKDSGYFDLVEQVRISVLLEKDSVLASVGSSWSDYSPRTQSGPTFRRMVEDKLEVARQTARATKSEKFPYLPFESLYQVVRSAAADLTLGPSTLHVIYVRAYENRQLDDTLDSSKKQLASALASQPWTQSLSTVSLLSYQEGSSAKCKPDPDEMGTDVARIFSGIAATSGELCDLTIESGHKNATLNAIFNTIADRQGSLILRRKTEKAKIDKVIVTNPITGKYELPSHAFKYDGREVLISTGEKIQESDEVEVIYEPI